MKGKKERTIKKLVNLFVRLCDVLHESVCNSCWMRKIQNLELNVWCAHSESWFNNM